MTTKPNGWFTDVVPRCFVSAESCAKHTGCLKGCYCCFCGKREGKEMASFRSFVREGDKGLVGSWSNGWITVGEVGDLVSWVQLS